MTRTYTFSPATGTEAEWNSAFYRLEDYLRALQLVNKVHQSQVILHLLELAAERHAANPSQNPTTLAMEEAREAMNRWFEEVLGRRDRMAVVGLLALAAADAAEEWPSAFLSDEVPVDFRKHMQESDLRAGPDLQVSSMVPRPIEVGPLLDPFHLTEVLGKAKWGLTLVAAVILLTALSASVILLLR